MVSTYVEFITGVFHPRWASTTQHHARNARTTRLQAEIELEQLQREEDGSAMTARDQVRTVTAGWLVGVVLGWAAGLVLGCLFSPALGFMLVGLTGDFLPYKGSFFVVTG